MHSHLSLTAVYTLSGEENYVNKVRIPVNYVCYTEDAGLPYFDHSAVIANGTWLCGSALKSMGAKLCFLSCLVNWS